VSCCDGAVALTSAYDARGEYYESGSYEHARRARAAVIEISSYM
jgi:hypothetical protein